MKKIFTILTFSLLTCAFAQERIVHQGRMWHPKPMQGDKMEAAMAKKTQNTVHPQVMQFLRISYVM